MEDELALEMSVGDRLRKEGYRVDSASDCRHLRDFTIQNPEGILGYVKKTAANATHDYFKHAHSQSSGDDEAHLSTTDIDLEAGKGDHGSQERIAFAVFLNEIDEYLRVVDQGPTGSATG